MPQTKKDRGKLLTQGQCRSNKNYLDVLSMHYERAPRFRRSRPSVAQSPFRYGGHNRSRGAEGSGRKVKEGMDPHTMCMTESY
jgi:hypothetical protein